MYSAHSDGATAGVTLLMQLLTADPRNKNQAMHLWLHVLHIDKSDAFLLPSCGQGLAMIALTPSQTDAVASTDTPGGAFRRGYSG